MDPVPQYCGRGMASAIVFTVEGHEIGRTPQINGPRVFLFQFRMKTSSFTYLNTPSAKRTMERTTQHRRGRSVPSAQCPVPSARPMTPPVAIPLACGHFAPTMAQSNVCRICNPSTRPRGAHPSPQTRTSNHNHPISSEATRERLVIAPQGAPAPGPPVARPIPRTLLSNHDQPIFSEGPGPVLEPQRGPASPEARPIPFTRPSNHDMPISSEAAQKLRVPGPQRQRYGCGHWHVPTAGEDLLRPCRNCDESEEGRRWQAEMEKMQKQAEKNPPIVTGIRRLECGHLVVIAGYTGRCRKCWEALSTWERIKEPIRRKLRKKK
jgi:hypothetical protein